MGVPGYFSWIHRKYPYQVKKVKQNGRKKHIDCLYIDVNGICYQYARDENNYNYLLNPKPLEAIFKQIFDHIDSIIEVIDPQIQVYLMMDGTCPRAKMNQQRQRRFHAQHNHVELSNSLKRHGFDVKHETVPNNSIAPGTPFMYELNQQLRRYIEARMALSNQTFSQEEANKTEHTVVYKKLQFILSDSNAPGEGEHKILEIIRKHTNLQLTHCIVGADADLLLLSLATIGKRILILREYNKFRPAEKGTLDEELDKLKEKLGSQEKTEQMISPREYDLVDINGLKRVILDKYKKMFDNKQIKNLLYNPMNIMDDFVFLSLFAGNDFLPRQNYMQIKNEKKREHILDMLIEKYDQYLENATTYLSDRGYIKFHQIIEFFKLVSDIEPHFKRNNIFEIPNTQNEDKTVIEYVKIMSQKQISDVEKVQDQDLIEYEFKDDELKLLQKHSKVEETEIVNDLISDSDKDESDTNKVSDKEEKKTNSDDQVQQGKLKENSKDNQNDECQQQKNFNKQKQENDCSGNVEDENKNKRTPIFEENNEIANILSDEMNGKEIYLKEKLQVKNQDEYDLIIMKYLEGFQFTLLYYFRGIEKASWNYYFPHFYAPLIQDTVEFLERNPKFEVKFIKTQTFQPFKQLLAILHPDNNEIFPKEFRGLFQKYLLPFCPEKLEIDQYGSTVSHMQIIKLPFIDLSILDKAYEEGEQALLQSGSAYDKNRNTLSKDTLFYYDQNSSLTIPLFNKLVHHAQIENAPIGEIHFSNLDHDIPELITNIVVDMEKKNAEKELHESKKKQKKKEDFNPDGTNQQYEKKGRYRSNKNQEQDDTKQKNNFENKEHKNNNHYHKQHKEHKPNQNNNEGENINKGDENEQKYVEKKQDN